MLIFFVVLLFIFFPFTEDESFRDFLAPTSCVLWLWLQSETTVQIFGFVERLQVLYYIGKYFSANSFHRRIDYVKTAVRDDGSEVRLVFSSFCLILSLLFSLRFTVVPRCRIRSWFFLYVVNINLNSWTVRWSDVIDVRSISSSCCSLILSLFFALSPSILENIVCINPSRWILGLLK